LSAAEAARRLEHDGPNRLAEAKKEPRWRAFLRQFQDLLIIILLIAAVISFVVTREWETPVVIALVVLLNATIGFVQESKAEASLEALKKMLVATATVRRGGGMVNLDAAELVAGLARRLDEVGVVARVSPSTRSASCGRCRNVATSSR
jgi:P-type Ca2+ transporter type 2C